MKVRVLGGGTTGVAWSQSGCLLVDDRIAFDSGGLVSQLSVEEQAAIDELVVTHAHLDHVGELAFLVDSVLMLRSTPLQIRAPAAVIEQMRAHLFNNQLWPDFSQIRIGGIPAIEFSPLEPAEELVLGGLTIRWARTAHPVHSVGYLVSDGTAAFLYSGDTGPTEALWELANRAGRLQAVFVETAFPNRLQHLAHAAGHLTPALLGAELAKLRAPAAAINVMHVKPAYQAEIEAELRALARPCRVMVGGELFSFA